MPAPAEQFRVPQNPAGDVPQTGDANLVAGIEQRHIEYDRLLNLCHQLRRHHRCPGRCVLRGELRRGGVAAFRSMLDGQG